MKKQYKSKSRKIYFIGAVDFNGNNIGGEKIKNQNFVRYLENKGVEKVIIDTTNWRKKLLPISLRILNLLIKKQGDKIFLSCADPGAYKFLKLSSFLNIYKKKIYYFVIGGILVDKIKNNYRSLKVYKQCTKIYVESTRMANCLRGLGLEQSEYLPNFKSFSYVPIIKEKIKKPIKLFFLSRINKSKGCSIIIRAMDKFSKVHNGELEVDFFGPVDEVYRDEFFKQINNKNYISYKGIIDLYDERNYGTLSNYDFMVFPTFHKGEGFPSAIIDSLIAGVPVIASKWRYIPEIVKNGYNGLLIKEINSDSLYDILLFITDKTNHFRFIEMRKNCIKEARKYKTENVLDKCINKIIDFDEGSDYLK